MPFCTVATQTPFPIDYPSPPIFFALRLGGRCGVPIGFTAFADSLSYFTLPVVIKEGLKVDSKKLTALCNFVTTGKKKINFLLMVV